MTTRPTAASLLLFTLPLQAGDFTCVQPPLTTQPHPLQAEAHLGYLSDYLFRGVHLGQHALESGLNLQLTDPLGLDWQAGIWTVSPDGSNDSEVDLFVNVSKDLGPLTTTLGINHYQYPGADADDDLEVQLGLSTEWQSLQLGLTAFYGLSGGLDEQLLLETHLSYQHPITTQLNSSLTLTSGFLIDSGQSDGDLDTGSLYSTLQLQLTYTLHPQLTLSPHLSYSTANQTIGDWSGLYGGAKLIFTF